jgi:hypothetical protein
LIRTVLKVEKFKMSAAAAAVIGNKCVGYKCMRNERTDRRTRKVGEGQ